MPVTPEGGFADRLVFLHGFTQTHHHWHDCAHLIAGKRQRTSSLAFVDLPGHGLSGSDRNQIVPSGPGLVGVAGAGTYIGYSMGGRFGLVAALTGQPAVERLVLIGATAGIDDAEERADRHLVDRNRAEHLEQIGVDRFLDEWLAAPMFAGLPADPNGLGHRRRNTAAGLAHSLRWCGTGNQVSLWHRLALVTIPVLVIAGELDTKFTEIGDRMATALPNASFASIDGAGHAAQVEQPEATAATIADWLATTDGPSPTSTRTPSP